MLHLCWNRTVVFSFSLTATSKWRGGNSSKQRYFGSLSAPHPYLPPHLPLWERKVFRGQSGIAKLKTNLKRAKKYMGTFKSQKNNSISQPPSLCNSENTLERCMFWTCAICEALGMANCSLAGFRPRFRQKILSITLSLVREMLWQTFWTLTMSE